MILKEKTQVPFWIEDKEEYLKEKEERKNQMTPVALYIRCKDYSDVYRNIDKIEEYSEKDWKDKERYLREYCDKHNYRVVAIYKDTPISYNMDFELIEMAGDSYKDIFMKVITIDFNDIGTEYDDILLSLLVIHNNDVRLETVNQGKITITNFETSANFKFENKEEKNNEK